MKTIKCMQDKIRTQVIEDKVFYRYKDVLKSNKINVRVLESRVNIKNKIYIEDGLSRIKTKSPYISSEDFNRIKQFINNKNKYRVYRYTSPNEKVYIGQTYSSLQQRAGVEGIGYKNCPKFYNEILKYGFENFKRELLLDNLTKEEANLYEKSLILYYINEGCSLNTLTPKGTINEYFMHF